VRASLLHILLVASACSPVGARDVDGPRRPPDAGPSAALADARAALAAPAATRLCVVERGAQGSRLVMVDEDGLRQRVLTEAGGATAVLDLMPAWSPDGRWIVFASSRERGEPAGERFSLWIVSALDPDATPVRLTRGAAVDWMPTWTPDGRAIVFASTGDAGSFDLWRLALEDGTPPRPGALTRLTSTPFEEAAPALSPDGKRLAYVAIEGKRHQIMLADADATHANELVEGDDPTWSPDGTWLAFVAPSTSRDDLDVWRIDANGRRRAPLVDDGVADEHAPRFSADGCWLLATSLLRNQMTQVVTSTLVIAPLCGAAGKVPGWQALVEVHPTPRMGVAVAPVPLLTPSLARAPGYKDALKRTLMTSDSDAAE
jgi:Tol biopolymer transport system component